MELPKEKRQELLKIGLSNEQIDRAWKLTMEKKGKASKPKLLKEVEKCIVLCSNCHRDLHHQEKLQDVT